MKNPGELAKKLVGQWGNATLREARLLGHEGAWPVVVPIGKPPPEMVRDGIGKVRDHVREWRGVSVGKVVWKEARYRATLETVEYPAQWVIENAEQWVEACAVQKVRAEYDKLRRYLNAGDGVFHPVLARRRTLWRDRPAGEVERCLRMAAELEPGAAEGLPLRALSAAGNDTKFFERNERLLVALLDTRFDGEASRLGLEVFLGAGTERGHWLLVVDLDGGLLPFAQIRLRSSELASSGLPGSHLLVVENENCLHQLPMMNGVVAVLGTGFDLNWMSAAWLREKKVGYWGDLDTWGMLLLGRAREKCAGVKALLMTREVFDAHSDLAVVETTCADVEALAGLTDDEKELFQYLGCQERGRLEQEFLQVQLVRAVLGGWF